MDGYITENIIKWDEEMKENHVKRALGMYYCIC